MIIDLESLIKALKPIANPNDTPPAEALWINVSPYPKGERSKYEKVVRTVDYRTNTVVILGGVFCREGPLQFGGAG
jgi:hypothetical protein